MRTITIVVLFLIAACGPSARDCERIQAITIDGIQMHTIERRDKYNHSHYETISAELEVQVYRRAITDFERDTTLIRLEGNIRLKNIAQHTRARLCGCP